MKKWKTRSTLVPLMVFLAAMLWVVPGAFATGHYGIPGDLDGCSVCHDFAGGAYAPVSGNLRWIKSSIEWPTGTVHTGVTFTSFGTPPGTLADGDDLSLDGPCEVCHTATTYHNNTGDGVNHLDGTDCTACHPHFSDDISDMFQPVFTGSQSHTTHWTDPKGPQMGEGTCAGSSGCHQVGSYNLFNDGLPLATTTACDDCHSPGGIDGVADAKAKWETGVYESDGVHLQAGNENWCASCHDSGTSIIDGVTAPNVMGDGTTWGYNVTGHGKDAIKCEDCHDLAADHTDGNARTYSAVSDNYRAGYRLAADMAIPRNGEVHPGAFALCTNCHIYTDITGDASNFRDDGKSQQYHLMHLEWFPTFLCADSDFDGVGCDTSVCIDSAMTCTTCHNVHGSPSPAMIRHGELISPPGTSAYVPALDLHWYKSDGTTETSVVGQSRYGSLVCGQQPNAAINHVCFGCHATGTLTWYRAPGTPAGINIEAVWTSDLADVTKTTFYPTESVRYHVRFTFNVDQPYFVQIQESGAGNTASMPGTDWVTSLGGSGTIGAGVYTVTWDRTIPPEAGVGDPAILLIKIVAYDSSMNPLQSRQATWDFSIVAGP